MNLYSYLIKPENLDIVVKLIRTGIIKDSSIITHLGMYEEFIEHPSPKKGDRYKALADKHNLDAKTISRIILKLKKQIR